MKLLSIDGGGIRGFIPALVLVEIEERTGKRICELFDMVAGTSTGGILACALSIEGDDGRPKFTARELVGLYETEGPKIFSRTLLKRIASVEGFIDERYDDEGLNGALTRFLGDARLKDACVPVFVTAYEIFDRFAFFFRSHRAQTDPTYDFSMVEAARATSAAPTYFEPFQVTDAAGTKTYSLVDGGVFAVNPAACAYAELEPMGKREELELIASLGTGAYTREYKHAEARNWGQLEWARPALDMVFDGMGETTDFVLATLLGNDYVRFQCELDDASDDMDNATPENLARLRAAAEALIKTEDGKLDRLCARLV